MLLIRRLTVALVVIAAAIAIVIVARQQQAALAGLRPSGIPSSVAEGNWNGLYPNGGSETFFQNDLYTHSMAPTADGTRTYLSMEGGEMLVLDTSAVASDISPGKVINLSNDLITNPADRPVWGNPFPRLPQGVPRGPLVGARPRPALRADHR